MWWTSDTTVSGNTDTSEETLVIVDTGSEPRLTCLSFIFFTSHPSYPGDSFGSDRRHFWFLNSPMSDGHFQACF